MKNPVLTFATISFMALASVSVSLAQNSQPVPIPTPESTSTVQAVQSTTPEIIPGSADDFAKAVGNIMYFDFDSSDLRPKTKEQLDNAIAWLNKYPAKKITIEGHADERGTRDYNLALGQRRAQAIADYLSAAGIASDRFTTISYGSDRPAVIGSDELHWMFNRRAVIVLN